MIFTNEFQISWVMYSSNDFRIQTSFSKLGFWVVLTHFSKCMIWVLWLLKFIVITCWIRLYGFGYRSKRKSSSHGLTSDWIKASEVLNLIKTCEILNSLSCICWGVMGMRWWLNFSNWFTLMIKSELIKKAMCC